jgi:pimeloyl-ACP methyl ester carboxylesterase
MPPMWMALALGIVGVVTVALVATARLVGRRRVATELAIRTPNGIDEAHFVRLGGLDQWVHIRGEHRSNPVVLMLHGGPGMSYATPTWTRTFRAWESSFTIVQWDRRGVGKTFARHGSKGAGVMTFAQLTDDGLALAAMLRARFPASPLILLGHSAGSVVGLHMVARRPDLFAAYVGTDQIVDMTRNEIMSYEALQTRLMAGRDAEALRAFARIGPPPYATLGAWSRKQALIMQSDGTSPRFRLWAMLTMPRHSLRDVYGLIAGHFFSARTLFAELIQFRALDLGPRFGLPMYFLQGGADIMTVTALVAEFVESISAPAKELVVLKGGPHLAMVTMSDQFLAELRTINGRLASVSGA